MKEVILHIGIHKTGSSSIQRALKNFKNTTTKYASFSEINHSIPIYTIFSEKKDDYHIWKNKGFTKKQIELKKKEYLSILTNDIKDTAFDRLIISGEDMCNLNTNEQENLCNFFKSQNIKVRVIAFVRHPESFALSICQQHIKGGANEIRNIFPGYRRRLIGFSNSLEKNNIEVYDFDNFVENRGLIKGFSEILNIQLNEPKLENESVTKEGLSLIYELNNIKILTIGSKNKFTARLKLIDKIKSFFAKSKGYTSLKYFNGSSILSPKTLKDLDWLNKNFSINYSLEDKGHSLNHKNISGSVLLQDIQSFFKHMGHLYDSSISLNKNIENLYKAIYEETKNQSYIDDIRDIALKIERKESLGIKDSLKLMKAAKRYRPDGSIINEKIELWEKLAKN